MKRNASEFASSATQPHLVPTLWSQLMVPTLCSQHRFHLRRTPVPPWPQISGLNSLVPTLRSELCGPTSGRLPTLPRSQLSAPNSLVPTLRSELSGPASDRFPCTPGPNPRVLTPGANSPVPTLTSHLRRAPVTPSVPTPGPNFPIPTRADSCYTLGPNSLVPTPGPNSQIPPSGPNSPNSLVPNPGPNSANSLVLTVLSHVQRIPVPPQADSHHTLWSQLHVSGSTTLVPTLRS